MLIRPISNEYVIAGDITIHYVQWGEQGAPILCLHGLTANAFSFQSLADELSIDHRVIAYDLRGRGDSDKPEDGYSVPIHAADLSALIDELGLTRPIIIGHSLGALIALYFAAHYPQKLSKFMLLDAGGPLPQEQPAWLAASVNRLGTPLPSYQEYIHLLQMMPFLGPYWNPYFDIFFQHDVRPESDGTVITKAYREGIFEDMSHLHEAKPAEQWAHIQVPTLLLRAGQGLFSDNDQLLSEEAALTVRRAISSCRYMNFPTLNHHTILFGVEHGPIEEIRKFIA
ncbi:MAG: alpha/beta hydrolase [Chloroflexi bacterium]|nr:MAG: alpha/beta hydrolase [Chloroflexota bacterium]